MFEHGKLQNPEAYFTDLDHRPERSVYFYRICGYNRTIDQFIRKYYEAARRSGVIIDGKLQNPDEKNLKYYEEVMGMDFRMEISFIRAGLQRWLPRMNDGQRENVAASVFDALESMRRAGKNDNMLRNAYIKFMCWFYYRFERIVNQLGANQVPKILYDGDVSNYELKMLVILSKAGCDIVLLQRRGDENYRKLDPSSSASELMEQPGMTPFPEEFSIRWLQKEMEKQWNREKLYGTAPQIAGCTNAWISGNGLEDLQTDIPGRGKDPRFFYNCFCRINGVEDKVTYLNELYQFQLGVRSSGRKLVVVENMIPRPTMEELQPIQRKNYVCTDQMLVDLSGNIRYTASTELEKLMRKSFIDILSAQAEDAGMNLNRLTNRAVYLLCWLKRYQTELFENWKMPDISCIVYLGGCQNENEAAFMRLLARLPVDVLILKPNLSGSCCLQDDSLYEIHYGQSLAVEKFPRENGDIRMGTAAYHAERELDTLMYQDSGIYRNQQYEKASSVTLRTMYEEIAILWDKETKYRPNFGVVNRMVSIPVIFAKVSGVKDGLTARYWESIRTLITGDTLLIREAPYIQPTDPNPVKAYAAGFFKNRKLRKTAIKEHSCYQYGFLREEMQDHILDKLELLIEQKFIKGTFENGTEYTIISTVLNLKKDILRMLQKFDFTKKNPKLIYIHTGENPPSLEDGILTAFLNLAGFDVVFFVPTGYQCIERYFNRDIMEEHQAGEYLYDLQVPDLNGTPTNTRRSWREKIFKRGI